MGFLLVIIGLFSLGVMVEALRPNIDWKPPFFEMGVSWPKISGGRGRPPPTICAWTDWPVNALRLCRRKFSLKETSQQTFFESPFLYEKGHVAF